MWNKTVFWGGEEKVPPPSLEVFIIFEVFDVRAWKCFWENKSKFVVQKKKVLTKTPKMTKLFEFENSKVDKKFKYFDFFFENSIKLLFLTKNDKKNNFLIFLYLKICRKSFCNTKTKDDKKLLARWHQFSQKFQVLGKYWLGIISHCFVNSGYLCQNLLEIINFCDTAKLFRIPVQMVWVKQKI